MKAVKRLFKRKKPREEGGVGDARPLSIPNKPILKSTQQVDPIPPHRATNQSSEALTARSDSRATWNTSVRMSEMSSTSPVVQKRKTTSVALTSTKGGKQSNDVLKASSPRASSPPTSGASKRPSIDQEKGTYKGVSESFKKGMSVTQRFGVGDAPDDHPSTDPNQLGKLADAYDSIPLLEQTKLPRGGISMETKAVGRIQVSNLRSLARRIYVRLISGCWSRLTLFIDTFLVRYSTRDNQG